ncbi:MAG: TMAO reductase system periplasmic protein TorT [Telluria sp.]
MSRLASVSVWLGLFIGTVASCAGAVELVRWTPPFSYAGKASAIRYVAPDKATQRWNLCIVFPHIKDAYWQAVNYGMLDEARRLAVAVQFSVAGGYPNLERQRELVDNCAADSAVDAIILGTVSFNGLSDSVRRASRRKPVLATVNDIANDGLSAKVGAPYYEMGRLIGAYLRARHNDAGAPVPIAWFPGPQKAGWVPFVDGGFRDAIRGSRISIVTVGWGDTDKTVQRNLVQSTLDRHPGLRYLIGNGMMAEAAISVLRERKLEGKIGIASTYLTPGVYRGIVRRKILAAPTDSPVVQGRLSIDQALAILEGRRYEKHVGPVIKLIDQDNLADVAPEESMPPPTFSPRF